MEWALSDLLVAVGALLVFGFLAFKVIKKKGSAPPAPGAPRVTPGATVDPNPGPGRIRKTAKWFYISSLKPAFNFDSRDPKSGFGNDARYIPLSRIEEFFAFCRATGMDTVCLKTAGFQFQLDAGWRNNVRWFMEKTREYGLFVQVSLCDHWHSNKNDTALVIGRDPGARFDWWSPANMQAKLDYIEATVLFFRPYPHCFYSLGNELDHSGLGGLFVQHGAPLLAKFRSIENRTIGASENDIFNNMPLDFGEVHNRHRMTPGPLPGFIVNELAGDTDLWRSDRIKADAGPYIDWGNRAIAAGAWGVCAATWLSLLEPGWNNDNVRRAFTHLGGLN